MRYVITGGSGYLGSVLTKRLAERDETERIVSITATAHRSSAY